MPENTQELALKEKTFEIDKIAVSENGSNGHHALMKTKDLPISKQISNEQLIAEERSLIKMKPKSRKIIRDFADICVFLKCRKSSECSRCICI